jgi:riboflavin biosynthesis pyrimidine reductase
VTTEKTPQYLKDELKRLRAEGGSEAVIKAIEAKLLDQLRATSTEMKARRK